MPQTSLCTVESMSSVVDAEIKYQLIMAADLHHAIFFLAHLSQSDRVSFCDRFSSGVRPASIRKLLL
jgi:hypothetical protein